MGGQSESLKNNIDCSHNFLKIILINYWKSAVITLKTNKSVTAVIVYCK